VFAVKASTVLLSDFEEQAFAALKNLFDQVKTLR
jgi:predicted DNA-binding protein YlxM (UPF0122 family)